MSASVTCKVLFTSKYLPTIFSYLTNRNFFKKFEKCYLFHLKSHLCSRGIQLFVFLSSPLYSLVGWCSTRWLKMNCKVFDVMMSPSRNLNTCWIIKLDIFLRSYIEIWPFDWIINRDHTFIASARVEGSWNFLNVCRFHCF